MENTMTAEQEEFIRSNAGGLREKVASGLEQIHRVEVMDGKAAIQNLRTRLSRSESGGQ